jgi:hypothetical protein
MAQSRSHPLPIEELVSHHNPFNYFHDRQSRRPPWPQSIQSQTVARLRDELLRRGLPADGTRAELVHRIKEHNFHVISPKGLREKYHRKLTFVKEVEMEAIAPFPQFRLFPVEVRLMIWEYSLPGPRVLTVSDNIHCFGSNQLHFREDDNLPNPGMLSACRESRSVALKKFKLCLGTPNVYVDFSGGDILYLGPHWETDGRIARARGELGALSELCHNLALVSEIKQIPRVALHNKIWRRFSSPQGGPRNGHFLRYEVHDRFPNLKELFLISGGPDYNLGSEFAKTPGHIVFEERPDLCIRNPPTTCDWMAYGFAYDVREKFMMLDKEPDERVWFDGTPEVKIVIEKRIPNIPGDDWERDKGEPLVSTSYLSTKTPRGGH